MPGNGSWQNVPDRLAIAQGYRRRLDAIQETLDRLEELVSEFNSHVREKELERRRLAGFSSRGPWQLIARGNILLEDGTEVKRRVRGVGTLIRRWSVYVDARLRSLRSMT
jgi:hypothetical protein